MSSPWSSETLRCWCCDLHRAIISVHSCHIRSTRIAEWSARAVPVHFHMTVCSVAFGPFSQQLQRIIRSFSKNCLNNSDLLFTKLRVLVGVHPQISLNFAQNLGRQTLGNTFCPRTSTLQHPFFDNSFGRCKAKITSQKLSWY